MNGRFANQVVMITGATRGIGFSLARAFHREGARIFLSATSAEGISEAIKRLGAGPECAGEAADLVRPEAAQSVVDAAIEQFGQLDILVNNAGLTTSTGLWEVSTDEWDQIHAVNLRSVFFASRAAALAMRDGGGGSIVNVSSIAGQTGGLAGNPAYASAKAGVIGLTRSLARQLAPHDIRVNAVAPADIETDMTAEWPQELRERLIAITPLGRFAEPDEVAETVLLLAGSGGSFITGQTININGGAYMG